MFHRLAEEVIAQFHFAPMHALSKRDAELFERLSSGQIQKSKLIFKRIITGQREETSLLQGLLLYRCADGLCECLSRMRVRTYE